jgi:DNA-binding XRE family transcriptional regulator
MKSRQNGEVMITDKNKFKAARAASGLSLSEASEVVSLSKQCYIAREKTPEQFRLTELEKLYGALDNTGKPILKDAVNQIFLS